MPSEAMSSDRTIRGTSLLLCFVRRRSKSAAAPTATMVAAAYRSSSAITLPRRHPAQVEAHRVRKPHDIEPLHDLAIAGCVETTLVTWSSLAAKVLLKRGFEA